MQVRSPQPSPSSRSALLRGSAGAGLCAIAIAAVALPVAGIWPGGDDHATTTPRIASMPDDSGLASSAGGARTPAHHKHKVARHTWAIETAGTQIVVRPGRDRARVGLDPGRAGRERRAEAPAAKKEAQARRRPRRS